MGDSRTLTDARTVTVREAYAALNRGDVAGFLRDFAARGLPPVTDLETWARDAGLPPRVSTLPGNAP